MRELFLILSLLLVAGCSQEKKENHSVVASNDTQKKESVETIDKREKPVAQKSVKKVEEVTPTKEEAVVKKVASVNSAVDGAKIFVKCSACHGKDAQKRALGKSNIIKGWKETKIVDALHGYKAGTYGGSMKAVMKGQVSGLSDAEIDAVAKYISKL